MKRTFQPSKGKEKTNTDFVYACLQQTDAEYLEDVELKEEKGYQFSKLKEIKIRLAKYKMSRKTNNSFSAHFYFRQLCHESICF